MHYPVIVVGKDDEPREQMTYRACTALDGDWAAEGGRYQGFLDGYDPESNPDNTETCDTCSGTGTRPDGLERFGEDWVRAMNGCNGCKGVGTRLRWTYVPHEEWAAGPAMLDPATLPWAVLLPDGYLVEFEGQDEATRRGSYAAAVTPWARGGYRATIADVHC